MDPDCKLVTNTFKTYKHDTKTAKNASQRFQIQIFLNLITLIDIQSNYARLYDLFSKITEQLPLDYRECRIYKLLVGWY